MLKSIRPCGSPRLRAGLSMAEALRHAIELWLKERKRARKEILGNDRREALEVFTGAVGWFIKYYRNGKSYRESSAVRKRPSPLRIA